MSKQSRPKPLPPERLPDVQLSGVSSSYASFSPARSAHPTALQPDHDEPAWWEAGATASLPDAPQWRAGSVVGHRLPPHSTELRARPLFEPDLDHGGYHQRERLQDFLGLQAETPPTDLPSGPQRRIDRELARRERRERRRQEREASSGPGGDRASRRDRSRRNRDEQTGWDVPG